MLSKDENKDTLRGKINLPNAENTDVAIVINDRNEVELHFPEGTDVSNWYHAVRIVGDL